MALEDFSDCIEDPKQLEAELLAAEAVLAAEMGVPLDQIREHLIEHGRQDLPHGWPSMERWREKYSIWKSRQEEDASDPPWHGREGKPQWQVWSIYPMVVQLRKKGRNVNDKTGLKFCQDKWPHLIWTQTPLGAYRGE